jgi:hypothetical protein
MERVGVTLGGGFSVGVGVCLVGGGKVGSLVCVGLGRLGRGGRGVFVGVTVGVGVNVGIGTLVCVGVGDEVADSRGWRGSRLSRVCIG